MKKSFQFPCQIYIFYVSSSGMRVSNREESFVAQLKFKKNAIFLIVIFEHRMREIQR